ncbi:hypothetical protein [Halomonas sp. AOP43-D1-4]|uniref:hypothetical protein n=1 Tax=Halomonas sp. AOP43-D1-4 TaxID=3457658 RepID=UPI0040345678
MSIVVNIQKVLWALNGLGQVTLQPGFMALFLLLMAATSQKVGYLKYRSSLDPVSWGAVWAFTVLRVSGSHYLSCHVSILLEEKAAA